MPISVCLKIIANLLAQNTLLRHQVAVLKRKNKRPRIKDRDRLLWVAVKNFGGKILSFDWRSVLHIVKADTVISWHRKLAAKLHAYRSRNGKKKRRSRISDDIRQLVRKMYSENADWGTQKILDELAKLSIFLSKRTLQAIIQPIKRPTPPHITRNWRTFIKNHAPYIWSADFFSVTTISFKQIYVFVILHLETRKILHINITEHPTADWTYQQIMQTTWNDPAPRYFLCDRDNKYGGDFNKILNDRLNIEVIRTPVRSPKANSHCERLIGSLRRECTDHFIFFGEKHLRSVLREYVDYYNNFRPHQGIDHKIPASFHEPPVDPFATGEIRSRAFLNGLHHHYYRQAA